tara:strand:- start:354 stop:617 length:264 start_codon:yes stop_codon:yes gene_type:complete
MLSKYLVEFLGTTIFLFTILRFPNPLLIALSLLVVIIVGGKISGGHFNPAVSVMKFSQGALSMEDMILYIVVQVLGGMFALCIYNMI